MYGTVHIWCPGTGTNGAMFRHTRGAQSESMFTFNEGPISGYGDTGYLGAKLMGCGIFRKVLGILGKKNHF